MTTAGQKASVGSGALTVERRCATPAEAVFQVLADGWSYAGWVVGASAIRDVDEGWPRPGARIHHSFGVWPLVLNDVTSVVEADWPRRLALRARAWPLGEAAVVLEVLPDGDGCRVRMSEEATRGVGRALPPTLRRIGLLPRNRESLRRLEFQSRRYV